MKVSKSLPIISVIILLTIYEIDSYEIIFPEDGNQKAVEIRFRLIASEMGSNVPLPINDISFRFSKDGEYYNISNRVFVAAERNVFDREKLFALHAPLDTLDKLYIHVIINYNKEGKRWMSHSVKSKIPIENNDRDKHAADTLVIRVKTQKSQSDQPEVYSGVTWESIPEPLTFDVFFQMNGDKKEILKREPDFESFSLEITGIPEKNFSIVKDPIEWSIPLTKQSGFGIFGVNIYSEDNKIPNGIIVNVKKSIAGIKHNVGDFTLPSGFASGNSLRVKVTSPLVGTTKLEKDSPAEWDSPIYVDEVKAASARRNLGEYLEEPNARIPPRSFEQIGPDGKPKKTRPVTHIRPNTLMQKVVNGIKVIDTPITHIQKWTYPTIIHGKLYLKGPDVLIYWWKPYEGNIEIIDKNARVIHMGWSGKEKKYNLPVKGLMTSLKPNSKGKYPTIRDLETIATGRYGPNHCFSYRSKISKFLTEEWSNK
ncbi:hypothetical protein DdX_13173 [Ditylenchus destructor]|uniref:Uncharacterized protein n=1 Tax=Ditylenchus destructor TaxID=166010 RepID=A0AAD4R306_9BILA|nr:hypothetical protein DdX_13173 [Ditylenchus destructor]